MNSTWSPTKPLQNPRLQISYEPMFSGFLSALASAMVNGTGTLLNVALEKVGVVFTPITQASQKRVSKVNRTGDKVSNKENEVNRPEDNNKNKLQKRKYNDDDMATSEEDVLQITFVNYTEVCNSIYVGDADELI